MWQSTIVQLLLGRNSQDGIPVNNFSGLINEYRPVGIPIESNTDMGTCFSDETLDMLWMQRPTVSINIFSIWLIANNDDLSAKLSQNFRRNFISRSISTVDNDFQSVEREVTRKYRFGKRIVAAQRIINTRRFANRGCRRPQMVNFAVNN